MQRDNVAPHAGAWIEIILKPHQRDAVQVAPHAGAWIEILKTCSFDAMAIVAPHAGAWIEMSPRRTWRTLIRSRTPCGCVD